MKLFLLAAITLGLSACVPTMPAPPASPLDAAHSRSVGLGYTGHAQIAKPGQDGTTSDFKLMSGGQFWLRRKSETFEGTESGVLVSFGMTSFAAAGGYVRTELKGLPEHVYVGTHVEGGWLWGGVGLPVAVSLSDGVWIYVQPTFRFPAYIMAHLPAGISLNLGESIRLDAQGGLSGAGILIGKSTPGSAMHDRMFVYGGFGLSRHW